MGSTRRVVTVPEQTKEGFLEEVPLKDEGTPVENIMSKGLKMEGVRWQER